MIYLDGQIEQFSLDIEFLSNKLPVKTSNFHN